MIVPRSGVNDRSGAFASLQAHRLDQAVPRQRLFAVRPGRPAWSDIALRGDRHRDPRAGAGRGSLGSRGGSTAWPVDRAFRRREDDGGAVARTPDAPTLGRCVPWQSLSCRRTGGRLTAIGPKSPRRAAANFLKRAQQVRCGRPTRRESRGFSFFFFFSER